ncbi:hypothetical protein SAMN05920897_11926 [Alkalispirochaeta americana]|uniref:Uncharacterized protein n=1 Tax=Alkalispirochaeta americana TaxID=159291 RepID=A0A1N6WXJ5_9SPIO|nr:hypothetical protein SAMN05920897_11926 [Alkalispirochaeta americana]
MTDAKKEIFVVPEAIGDPFDHLDLVVHTFENTGIQPVSCVCQQALHYYVLSKLPELRVSGEWESLMPASLNPEEVNYGP